LVPIQKLNNLIYGLKKKVGLTFFLTPLFVVVGSGIEEEKQVLRSGINIPVPDLQHTGSGIELTEAHLFAVDDLLPEVGLGQFDNILPLAGPGIAMAPTTAAAGTTFK